MKAVNFDTNLGAVVWSKNGDSSMSLIGQPGEVKCVPGIEPEKSQPEGRPVMSWASGSKQTGLNSRNFPFEIFVL